MTDRVLILDEEQAALVRVALSQLQPGLLADVTDEETRVGEVLDMLDGDPLEGWQPDRWWQVVDVEIERSTRDWRKALWCETSDEAEARLHMKKAEAKGREMRLQRFWRMELRQALTDEENAKAMSTWRART